MSDIETTDPAKLSAEIKKLEAEAIAAFALARRDGALAREAEAKAAKLELELVALHEKETTRRASDSHNHVYQFDGKIDSGSVMRCMSQMREWDRLDSECDIELLFNSPGGSVIDGMALFDLLVRLSKRGGGKHCITIGTQGYAASMAGILLQAADVRWIGAQSYLMIHEVSAGTGGKIGEMKDDVKFYDAICARVVDIFVKRSEGKITRAKFKTSWERTDWWMLSDEALKLGFVDEIR